VKEINKFVFDTGLIGCSGKSGRHKTTV